jgi:hypothetical protein
LMCIRITFRNFQHLFFPEWQLKSHLRKVNFIKLKFVFLSNYKEHSDVVRCACSLVSPVRDADCSEVSPSASSSLTVTGHRCGWQCGAQVFPSMRTP